MKRVQVVAELIRAPEKRWRTGYVVPTRTKIMPSPGQGRRAGEDASYRRCRGMSHRFLPANTYNNKTFLRAQHRHCDGDSMFWLQVDSRLGCKLVPKDVSCHLRACEASHDQTHQPVLYTETPRRDILMLQSLASRTTSGSGSQVAGGQIVGPYFARRPPRQLFFGKREIEQENFQEEREFCVFKAAYTGAVSEGRKGRRAGPEYVRSDKINVKDQIR